MSNLAVRLLTAAVVVPLLLLLLYKGPAWGLYFLVLPATLIGTYELVAMTHPGDRISQGIALAMAAAVSVALYWTTDPRFMLTIIAVVPVIGPVLTLLRLGDIHTAALRAITMSVAPLFVAAPLAWLAVVRRDVPNGASYVVMALMFAWFSDTGGYFRRTLFGKTKALRSRQPEKRWKARSAGSPAA